MPSFNFPSFMIDQKAHIYNNYNFKAKEYFT